MRFAITANDRYQGVFEAFVNAGWKPLKLFTVPSRSDLGSTRAVTDYAERVRASIQISRMTESDMRELRDQGCEALIVASYDWVIGDWAPFLKYAVNFHCSPLPVGRGAYPAVRAILEQHPSWGVTCHRLTPEVDAGEILDAENFPLQSDECHESLDLKIQMAAKHLAKRVAGNFVQLWEQAKPQSESDYWPKFTLAERTIDFRKPVAEILRLIRAYGAMESLAQLGDQWLIVRRAVGWTGVHSYPPGHVVHVFNRSIVVTAEGGYIGILESDVAPPHVVAELQAATFKE